MSATCSATSGKPEEVALKCSEIDTTSFILGLFEQNCLHKILHPICVNKKVCTVFEWSLRPTTDRDAINKTT